MLLQTSTSLISLSITLVFLWVIRGSKVGYDQIIDALRLAALQDHPRPLLNTVIRRHGDELESATGRVIHELVLKDLPNRYALLFTSDASFLKRKVGALMGRCCHVHLVWDPQQRHEKHLQFKWKGPRLSIQPTATKMLSKAQHRTMAHKWN